jgi:hypothetical protein
LLNRRRVTPTAGSNPALSAISFPTLLMAKFPLNSSDQGTFEPARFHIVKLW